MSELPLSVLANILSHLEDDQRESVLGIERLPPLHVEVEENATLWTEDEVRRLNEAGYFVRDGFTGDGQLVERVAQEAMQCQHMKAAGLKRGVVDSASRSDEHVWLDEEALLRMDAVRAVVDRLERMQRQVQHEWTHPSQTQLTRYPPNTRGYVKHIDACVGSAEQRRITMLFYANAGWRQGDGGELRIHLADGGHVDVEPRGDRLLVFQSRSVVHEVLPTRGGWRVALTRWCNG